MKIEFKDVHKSYKKTEVLKGIDFGIEKGQLVSLIGPSGCGKTTSLKMINGLVKPSSGDILIDGKSILGEDLISLRRKMGYVIQQTGLFPHMTIQENIEIIPRLMGEKAENLLEKTKSLMKMVGLSPEDFLWRYPAQLSGGQLQRIGVARAFAVDPEIILMDEPFSALDPITREQLQDEIISIQNKFHKTIVFVTHDMDEAIKISDKICIMNGGKILQYDSPENILKSPANEFVEDFVGEKRIWSSPKFIKARDIMIKTPVKTGESSTVLRAMGLMRRKRVDSVFIVDSENKLKGMVLAKKIQNASDKSENITNYMQQPKVTVFEEENIVSLLNKSHEKKASRMPVIDKDGCLVGLITKSSLVTTLSSQFIDTQGDDDDE